MVNIRVNIAGELAKIRKGVVYKDSTAVLDELLQNCQRAGASTVVINIADDMIQVIDDGCGASDPQILFEKSTSGWGLDEAFGEGFFSVFAVADTIKVASQDWEVEIDVEEMLRTGNFSFEPKKLNEVAPGFFVELHGRRIREEAAKLRSHVLENGPYLSLNIILNGSEVAHKDLLEPNADKQDVARRFDNEIYSAVLWAEPWGGKLLFYYDGRPAGSEYWSYLGGKIIFKPNKITLRAPDRKELIHDEKYEAFREQIAKDARLLFIDLMKQDADNLWRWEGGIGNYCQADDVADYVTINSDNVIGNTDHAFTKPVRLKQIKNPERIFWISSYDQDNCTEIIQKIKDCGGTVVIARNPVERMVMSSKFHHVDEFVNLQKTTPHVENIGPLTSKEERVEQIFRYIECHLSLGPGSLRIADVAVKVEIQESGGNECKKLGEYHPPVLLDPEKCPVVAYFDRKHLRVSKISGLKPFSWQRELAGLKDRWTVGDLRFILANLDLLAENVAILQTGRSDTNKARIDKVKAKLVNLFLQPYA